MQYSAVIFDLGGVVFASPLESFDVYNDRAGLPTGFVRDLVRASAENGAWARHERGELSMEDFLAALDAEGRGAGHKIDSAALMATVGEGFGPRPQMIAAITTIRERGLKTAALTNNWVADPGQGVDAALDREALFDVVVESAVEGVRKPEPAIYTLVLDRLGEPASACVFLDDLGPNLKPAREMGITTIKVGDPDLALAELSDALGFALDRD